MGVYNPQEIEPKWQRYWDENNVFVVSEDPNRPKYYVLDMFPYPSGAGLHVGHPEGYTATDIIARYKRMKGFNVLHPMGWDAFGLPAEQYALQTGTHPAVTTKKNINNFRSQLKRLGFGYDWSREVATCDEDYYKWTQWIFTKLYQKGLAYIAEVPVNWCPELGTVLANEEVIDGKSERGGYDVIRRPMRQWMLKITDYAESLLDGLDGLDWPEPVKEMQRNWIGKSEGALVRFSVTEDKFVEVYTTRPDTLFGATYLVLAPEHELVGSVTTTDNAVEVKKYVELAVNKTDRARLEDAKQKTGVFTGGYATNPLSGETVPIYVADYVLVTYGTGAIMAVPGHDERDYEFAQKFGLEIREVVSGGDLSKEAFTGNGPLVNSGEFSGLSVSEAKKKIIGFLEKKGLGTKQINYKLRDWLFSRQRYWGEPFPIVHKDGNPVVLDESELPVVLPEVEKYQPTEDGEPPLARAKNWLEFEHGEHGQVVRETNTMPQWAGSCWYYLRYIDPQNAEQFVEKEKEEYWMPVDLYIGGTEHAVLHLLYSRFWHHVLHDLGLVSCREPFRKLVNQGMILGEDGQKMSKARGNVVNPDDIVDRFGADTLRLYEMFMGPLEQVKPWNTNSVGGVHKFLKRANDWITSDRVSSNGFNEDFEKLLHQTIKKVTDDIENLRFHTAISQLMVCNNEAIAAKNIGTDQAKRFLQLVSPFAPHLGEELWSYLGETNTIADSIWPTFDEKYLAKQEVTVVFQVNGKVRDKCLVSAGLEKSDLLRRALSSEKVKKYLEEKEVVREIVVPDKLVNIVVK